MDEAFSQSVDESSKLGLDSDEKLKLDEHDSIIPISTLTSPKTITETPTKSYVYSSHEINRNRRDLSSVYNDQDNEFDNKNFNHLVCLSVNRAPLSNNELVNKKHIDDSIGDGIILGFNQTLDNFSSVIFQSICWKMYIDSYQI